MTTPIVETITANIASELAEIDGTGGWNFALTIVRPTEAEFGTTQWKDLTVLVYKGEADLIQSEMGLESWSQKYLIMAFVQIGENSTALIDTRKDLVASDIHKKLKEDIRRGLAANCWATNILKKTPFHDPGKSSGIALEVEVLFKHQLGNPYA